MTEWASLAAQPRRAKERRAASDRTTGRWDVAGSEKQEAGASRIRAVRECDRPPPWQGLGPFAGQVIVPQKPIEMDTPGPE